MVVVGGGGGGGGVFIGGVSGGGGGRRAGVRLEREGLQCNSGTRMANLLAYSIEVQTYVKWKLCDGSRHPT